MLAELGSGEGRMVIQLLRVDCRFGIVRFLCREPGARRVRKGDLTSSKVGEEVKLTDRRREKLLFECKR